MFQINFGSLDCTVPSFEEWKEMPEDDDYDTSSSEPLNISIPPLRKGFLAENMARFSYITEHKKHDSGKKGFSDKFGNVQIKWSLQGGDVAKIRQFNVTWKTIKDDGISVQQESYEPDVNNCSIPVYSKKCLMEVLVQPIYDEDEESDLPKNTQHVQVLIPGPPDKPELWLKTIRESEFIVEWVVPTLNGGKVDGYQLLINGKKAGDKLSAKHTRAVVPCKSKRLYHLTLVALSDELGQSEQSDVLTVSTFPIHSEPNIDVNESQYKDPRSTIITTKNYGNNYGDDDGEEIPLKVVRVESTFLELDWRGYNCPDEIKYFKIKWKLAGQRIKKEVKLRADETNCVLHNCIPGSTYSICLYVYNNHNKIIDRSSAIKVVTLTPLKPPVLSLKALNFNYLTIEWNDLSLECSLLNGYKLFMNGVLHCSLQKDQNSYSYSGGDWCKEYVIQIQALADQESYNSVLSEPLVINWPGVLPPTLSQAPSRKSNVVRIIWDRITTRGNAKIKNLKIVISEDESEKIVETINNPLNSNECEIEGLKTGNYQAFLEIQLHGTQRTVRTTNISITSLPVVRSLVISVKILNLETRRTLDEEAAALVNRRDKLLSSNYRECFLPSTDYVPQHSNNYSKDDIELKSIDKKLDSCLAIIDEHFTGAANVLLTWSLPEADIDASITGIQLYLDGRKYGHELKPTIKSIPIMLPTTQAMYQIFIKVISMTHQLNFLPSNVIEVSTEAFLPFSFFTFLSQKPKKKNNTYIPTPYSETLSIERKYSSKKPIHQGYLRKPVGISTSSTGVDIFDGSSKNLFSSSKNGTPNVLYFWSPQVYNNIRMLEWMKYITEKEMGFDLNILTVACGDLNVSGEGMEILTSLGWNDLMGSSHFLGNVSPDGSETLVEIFGVVGFPTFLFCNSERNIVWRGRYCALDSQHFESFFKFVFMGVDGGSTPTLPDPWLCNITFDDPAFRNKLLSNYPNLAFGSNNTMVLASKKNLQRLSRRKFISVTNRPNTSINQDNSVKLHSLKSTGHIPRSTY